MLKKHLAMKRVAAKAMKESCVRLPLLLRLNSNLSTPACITTVHHLIT